MEKFGSVNKILDFAIPQEQNAVDFYLEIAENSVSTKMKASFLPFANKEMAATSFHFG